jgi:hypothetical protein
VRLAEISGKETGDFLYPGHREDQEGDRKKNVQNQTSNSKPSICDVYFVIELLWDKNNLEV